MARLGNPIKVSKKKRQFHLKLAIAICTLAAPLSGHAAQRVVSLDMCADQYVLGLLPPSQIAGLSMRSQLPESYYRLRARGLRQVPAKAESVIALTPDLVVRTWGGDARLIAMLEKNGIPVITINDIIALDQAKSELLRVANALNIPDQGRLEADRFEAALREVRPSGLDRTALYYTPSGYSAGPGTLVSDMLLRMKFRMESQTKGFYPLSPEVLLSKKPDVFALAFYEDAYAMRRVPGRHPLVRKMIETTPHFTIPSTALACGAWYAAYDLRDISVQGVR